MSLLPQLSTYTGMLLVGLFIPILLRKKRKQASDYKLMIEQEQPPSPTIIPTIENNVHIDFHLPYITPTHPFPPYLYIDCHSFLCMFYSKRTYHHCRLFTHRRY